MGLPHNTFKNQVLYTDGNRVACCSIIPWKTRSVSCLPTAVAVVNKNIRHLKSVYLIFQKWVSPPKKKKKKAGVIMISGITELEEEKTDEIWLGEGCVGANSSGTFSRRYESWCSPLYLQQRRHTNKLYSGKLRMSMKQPQQRYVGVATVHFLQIGEISHAFWKVSEALNAVVSCWTP